VSDNARVTENMSLDDLTTLYRLLEQLGEQYERGSPGEETLVEARRLVEGEATAVHGYDKWRAFLDSTETR
jgi:hypothetical protein